MKKLSVLELEPRSEAGNKISKRSFGIAIMQSGACVCNLTMRGQGITIFSSFAASWFDYA